MAVSRFVAASLLGLLGLSSTALAMPPKGFPGAPAPPPDSVSSAKCEVVSIGAGDVVAARTEAVAKAASFVCGGEGSADAEAVARASATAFAKATAEVSGKCEISGNAEGHIWGYAGAVAEGTVWVEAYAEALASSVACGKCDSFAESWAYIGKEVFLKAVAETEADISLYSSDPTEKVQQVHALSTDIEEAIVYAYADALTSVSYVYDQHSCYAFGDTTGCIITEDHPFGFCVGCQVGSVSYGAISEINAIAEASASATALACGDTTFSIASALAVASSIAEAHAEATSYIYADCSSSDGGYACAQADSQISETAKAVAEAFADAWAGAVSCGGCYIGKDKLADDIEVILVEASTAAWGSLCVADGDYWGVADFQSEIESGYAEAIAEACALAVAVQPPGECLAAVTANADVEVTK